MTLRERLERMERESGLATPLTLSPELIEQFEERAAVCEFHGEMSREDAERVAMECVRRVMDRQGGGA